MHVPFCMNACHRIYKMQRMVYRVVFKPSDVSHTIVCSPLVGIHDRARQNMALYNWQERFSVSAIHDLHKTKSGIACAVKTNRNDNTEIYACLKGGVYLNAKFCYLNIRHPMHRGGFNLN